MMKLIIQIPCYNEAKNLPRTLNELPRTLPGVDAVEYLVIDDGSDDNTAEIAREHGVHHVLLLNRHQGLARAFSRGLTHAIALGADIIVNTDGDNQYQANGIPALIQPILEGQSDIVIGCRKIDEINHFSKTKKFLQKFGSWMVRVLSGTSIPDVTSGFRAYSRAAARRLRVLSDFSYSIETLIQAGQYGIRVNWCLIDVNPPTRRSRLFRSNWYYIRKQAATILRIWSLYSPVKLFVRSGLISLMLGLILLVRFIFYYVTLYPLPSGKVQSVVIAAVFLIFGLFLILSGVLADLAVVNRHLMEEILEKLDSGGVSGTNESAGTE